MSEIKIGHVIKRLLKGQRRNLKEVSRETGIPYSTLHTWHENRQPKDIIKVQRLADYLGVSLHRLLFDQEDSRDAKESAPVARAHDEAMDKLEIIVRRIE